MDGWMEMHCEKTKLQFDGEIEKDKYIQCLR
jgi:hypothetical protein